MANQEGQVCNPYGDVIMIDFSPNQAFGRFPPFFSRLYPDAIPMRATLIDPLGNTNTVSVEKIGIDCYFTDDWAHFGRYYGIEDGAYIRLVYVGLATFRLTIRTYKWIEWVYPPIPEPLDGDGVGAGVNMAIDEEDMLVANNLRFPLRLVKWISFAEYTGDVMSVGEEFCGKALIRPDSEIYIVDEYGKLWPCFFRRGLGSQGKTCVITKGWARFARRKGLQQGQRVMFGVTRLHSNQLHFIPVV